MLVKKSKVNNDRFLHWRSHVKNLFEEILNNPGTGILRHPLQITLNIMSAAAAHAATLKDEKMIAYFVALSIYTFSDPENKEDYDEERTKYYMDILNKS